MQFDLGRMEANNLPANAPQLWPNPFGAHAAAIHDNSGNGECTICNECLPMTLDPRFFESHGNRFQECAIVHLSFARNMQSLGESRPKGGFQFVDSRTL